MTAVRRLAYLTDHLRLRCIIQHHPAQPHVASRAGRPGIEASGLRGDLRGYDEHGVARRVGRVRRDQPAREQLRHLPPRGAVTSAVFSSFLMPLRHLRRWRSGIRKLLKTALVTGARRGVSPCVVPGPVRVWR